jgi:adenylate cyclase
MTASRRLAAVLATDVAGYSRKALRRELLDPKISEHHRLIVKTTGDGMLVEFASVVGALGGRGAAGNVT